MCWHVEFKVEMLDKKDDVKEKLEELINEFKIKPKRGFNDVVLLKGSVNEGYRTALHCDCDHVIRGEKEDETGFRIEHYPEILKTIIEQKSVRTIQLHFYLSKDNPESDVVKITISEFLKQNDDYKLKAGVIYKIIKDKYY